MSSLSLHLSAPGFAPFLAAHIAPDFAARFAARVTPGIAPGLAAGLSLGIASGITLRFAGCFALRFAPCFAPVFAGCHLSGPASPIPVCIFTLHSAFHLPPRYPHRCLFPLRALHSALRILLMLTWLLHPILDAVPGTNSGIPEIGDCPHFSSERQWTPSEVYLSCLSRVSNIALPGYRLSRS